MEGDRATLNNTAILIDVESKAVAQSVSPKSPYQCWPDLALAYTDIGYGLPNLVNTGSTTIRLLHTNTTSSVPLGIHYVPHPPFCCILDPAAVVS